MKRTKQMRQDNDRERVLVNIAAMLAGELAYLQTLPAVREHLSDPHSLSRVLCKGGLFRKEPFPKGALVLCETSRRQQNPFLVALVEANGSNNDPNGLLLRAIGTNDLCNYGNESFTEIIGIPEHLLWTGEKRSFDDKLRKALRKMDTYIHRFRGVKFIGDNEADVYFGEIFGGGPNGRTKPYAIRVKFDKKTTLKNITKQLNDGGFGTRKFEPDDGGDSTPFGNPKPITRADVVNVISAHTGSV